MTKAERLQRILDHVVPGHEDRRITGKKTVGDGDAAIVVPVGAAPYRFEPVQGGRTRLVIPRVDKSGEATGEVVGVIGANPEACIAQLEARFKLADTQ